MRSRAARRIWKWSAATFAVVVIMLAVAVGLFRLLLPLAPGYHEQIEEWASAAVGYPVRLTDIDARWRVGGPQLAFSQIEVLSPDRSSVLFKSASGSVGLSVMQLIRERSVIPDRIVLDQADLNVVRTAEGRIRFERQQNSSGKLNLQDLPVGSIYLRDARVTFHDQQHDRGPWTFDDMRLRLTREVDALHVDGQADLPAALGERLNFGLRADGLPEDLAEASWTFEFDGTALNLSGIAALVPEKLLAISDGVGDLEVLASLRGSGVDYMHITGDFENVAFSQPAGHVLDRLSADVKWERKPGGWRVSGERVEVESDGTIWPETQFVVDWRSGQPDEPDLLYADASFARLEDIAPFASWIPDASVRAFFLEQAPRGTVHGVSLHRSVADDALSGFSLRGSFDGFGINASDKLPGFDGLDGSVRADANGGEVTLSSQGLRADLPTLFNESRSLDAFSAHASWRNDAAGVVVNSDYELSAPGAKLNGEGKITLPAGGPVTVNAVADLVELDVARIPGFLPDKRLPPKVGKWFSDALVAGKIENGSVRFDGPLEKFPFDDDEGEFEARFTAHDVTLAYAKGWPSISGATIDTVWRNASVESTTRSGSSSGLEMLEGRATIGDIREGDLSYSCRVKGTLADTLAFLRQSAPVEKRAGKLLSAIEGGGAAETKFVLSLPLKDRKSFTYNAAMSLQNAVLKIDGLPHEITDIEGVLQANRNAITAERLSGAIFGRPVLATVEPASRENGQLDATLIRVNGRIAATDLVDNVSRRLDGFLDGETGWNALVRLPAVADTDPVTLTLMSDLSGLAVSLPEPLAKTADNTVAFSLGLEFSAEDVLGISARFDNRMQAVGELARADDRWQIGRANIAFGDVAPRLTATEDIVVSGSLARFAVAEWLALGDGEPGQQNVVKSLDLTVGELDLFGQKLTDARMLVDRNPEEWLVQLRSERVDGSIFFPKDKSGGAPVVLDMVKLHVQTPGEKVATRAKLPDPRTWPALTIRAADFKIGERDFGRLTAEALSGPDGLEFTRIVTESPSFTTDGVGAWKQDDATGQRTELRTTMTSNDVRATLQALGFASNIESESAGLTLDVTWPGSPASNFLASVGGTVSLETASGQFLDIDPGAGRVFGLLSLSALPRRLSLDFRDVFDKGFGFDSIRGDFTLENGDAYTNNLILEGPAADVGIIGRTGLSARDYDQTAVVRANVGSALPVAGALAVGPGLGAALLILSEIFKDPLKDMSRVHYRVTGGWDDPLIERVQPSELAATGDAETPLRN